MLKLAALVFSVLLLVAHCEDDALIALPLSMLRDGKQSGVGVALFSLLLFIGLWLTGSLYRARKEGETLTSALAVVLLLIVALTPSTGGIHGLCSFLLLGLLHVYYGILLYEVGMFWLFLHVGAPVFLLGATQLHSYGLWQKSLIVYFVLAATLRHHLLVYEPTRKREKRSDKPLRRRKVYHLEPGRTWVRRDNRLCGSSSG